MKLDKVRFQQFVKDYPASSDEQREPTHWLDTQKVRHGLVLDAYLRHRSSLGVDQPALLDVGAFPGSLVKALRLFVAEKGVIDAAGLASSPRFEADLAAHQIRYLRANLDPLVGSYEPLQEEVSTRLDKDDGSYDVAFCTEMIEHTLDPFFALRELHRLLRPGGLLILTTPNQAVLSHRLRLLSGRSIYYTLKHSIMYHQPDWRPHFREYTMAEMSTLIQDARFEIVERQFMDLTDDDPRIWNWGHPLLRLGKELSRICMTVPSLRHNLLFVARRVA